MKKISTKVKPLQTGGDGTAYYGEEVIKEKALSKKQQRFFGIVRAIQKGEQEPTTPETAKAAADMEKSDVKKYASTKHAKLPEKKIDEVYRPKRDAEGNIIPPKPIKLPLIPKRDAEGNIIPPKPIKLPLIPKRDAEGNIIPPKPIKMSNKSEIKEAVPLIVKAAMLGAGMVAKKALTGKKKKKEKEEVGPTIMVTKVVEELDKKDKPFVKKLVKKLRKGSKTHAKQADDLEKAMNEDMSDKDFKKLNKDMHDTAKAGGGASQEIQNKYALELARRRKINKDGTVSTLTNKALKNEETAIESDLVIQDWNKDDIKFTEIETIDIIKAKPLKENDDLYEGFKTRMIAKFGKKLIKNIGKVNPFTKTGAQRVTQGAGTTKKYIPPDKVTSQNIQTKSVVNQAKKMVDLSKKPNKGTKAVKVDLSKPIDFDKYLDKSQKSIKKKFIDKRPTGTFTDDLPPANNPKGKKPLKDHYDWRTEIDEDWQKINRKDKTDGLSRKAVKAYRRENPGSKLQTAVTKDPKKLKKGSKSAKRRLSFCRRMKGMKKKLTSAKTRRDPDSRINKALRRWNC